MVRTSKVLRIWVTLGAMAAGAVLIPPPPASAQEEVTSAIRRYKQYESSTGYYEEYESKPRRQRPLISVPGVSQGVFPYSPSGADVRNRSRLADSHQGIEFYNRRRCEECHARRPRTSTRCGLTSPVASAMGESPSQASSTTTHP